MLNKLAIVLLVDVDVDVTLDHFIVTSTSIFDANHTCIAALNSEQLIHTCKPKIGKIYEEEIVPGQPLSVFFVGLSTALGNVFIGGQSQWAICDW